MKKGSKEIIEKITYVTDNLYIYDNLEMEDYCELLNKSKYLNLLVEKLVNLNIDIVSSKDMEAISDNYLVNMLVCAYTVNNPNILGDREEEKDSLEEEIKKFKTKCVADEDVSILAYRNSVLCYLNYLRTCPEPIDSFEEQKEFFKKIKAGDKEAYDYFVKANLRLVYFTSKRFMKSNTMLDFMDVIQEGNLGLMKAVDKFDVSKNCKFSGYAINWIKQSIIRAINNKERCIRLPVHVYEDLAKINKVMGKLEKELGRVPTNEEIALETKLTLSRVSYALNSSDMIMSLHEEIRVGNDFFGDEVKIDYVADKSYDLCDDVIDKEWLSDLGEIIYNVVNNGSLKERERFIIINRFGLNGEEPKSLEKIGKMLGVTRECIRQREVKAFRKLGNNTRVRKIAAGVVRR